MFFPNMFTNFQFQNTDLLYVREVMKPSLESKSEFYSLNPLSFSDMKSRKFNTNIQFLSYNPACMIMYRHVADQLKLGFCANWSAISKNPFAVEYLQDTDVYNIIPRDLAKNPNPAAKEFIERHNLDVEWNPDQMRTGMFQIYQSNKPYSLVKLAEDKMVVVGDTAVKKIAKEDLEYLDFHKFKNEIDELYAHRPELFEPHIISRNPSAISFILEHQEMIDSQHLCTNPSIYGYDYNKIKQNMLPIKIELQSKKSIA